MFEASIKKRLHKRWTETVLAWMGDVGGITQLMILVCSIIIAPFVKHIMHLELIKNIYQIQDYNRDLDKFEQKEEEVKDTLLKSKLNRNLSVRDRSPQSANDKSEFFELG